MLLVKGTCCESWIPPVKPPSAADTCSLSVEAFQTPGSFWTRLFWRVTGRGFVENVLPLVTANTWAI